MVVANKDLKAKMEPIVRKLKVKANVYDPDSYPNPCMSHASSLQ